MSDVDSKQEGTSTEQEAAASATTRRAFSRGALGGAVFMTLGSRVAWGQSSGQEQITQCISTGVLMSVNPAQSHLAGSIGASQQADRDSYTQFLNNPPTQDDYTYVNTEQTTSGSPPETCATHNYTPDSSP